MRVVSPSVDRPASRDRAQRETLSGQFGQRLEYVLRLVEQSSHHGLTWREVADLTGLHHGQVSGALSTLHKEGMVVSLRATRGRCHPYVARRFAWLLDDGSYFVTPAKTRATHNREVVEQLVELAGEWSPLLPPAMADDLLRRMVELGRSASAS